MLLLGAQDDLHQQPVHIQTWLAEKSAQGLIEQLMVFTQTQHDQGLLHDYMYAFDLRFEQFIAAPV